MSAPTISAGAVTAPATPQPPRCTRCGYDLRGVAPNGNCPECGLPVERSVGNTDAGALWQAPPSWLAKLSWGARLVLLTPIVAFVYGAYVSRHIPWQTPEQVFAIPVALSLAFVAGVWLLTARQPHVRRSNATWRWALRAASLSPLATEFVDYARLSGVWRMSVLEPDLVLVTLAAFPALLCFHLRRLARRVLNPSLAEHCAIVGVGGTASLAAGFSGIFVRTPMAFQFAAMVGVALFTLWLLYLMARFAIAFHRAHRASAAAWGHA